MEAGDMPQSAGDDALYCLGRHSCAEEVSALIPGSCEGVSPFGVDPSKIGGHGSRTE
jgi:hypothetical protein